MGGQKSRKSGISDELWVGAEDGGDGLLTAGGRERRNRRARGGDDRLCETLLVRQTGGVCGEGVGVMWRAH